MAKKVDRSSSIQCTGCGRELNKDTEICPFCGTVLPITGAALPEEQPEQGDFPELTPEPVAADQPMDWVRFALAGTVGLLAALILGYAWYLLAVRVEGEYALAALVIGLVVGWVVALVSEGNLAIPYRILGAILAAAGVAFGQYLIYARPQSSFYFEFSPILLLIYGFALLEGWQAPQIFARRGLIKRGLIGDSLKGPLLGVSLILLAALIGAGSVSGILVGPAAVQAKIHATRALTLLEEGDFAQAEAEFQLALEDYEEFADAHFFLGLLRASVFVTETAITHFERALEIGLDGRRLAEAHYRLGLADWFTDQSEDALAHLNLAIETDNEHAEAYLIRGALSLESGLLGPASADLNRALALGLEPNDEQWANDMLQEINSAD